MKLDVNDMILIVLDMLKQENEVSVGEDIVFVSGVKDTEINSQFQIKLIEA
jgi:hypothetical protein